MGEWVHRGLTYSLYGRGFTPKGTGEPQWGFELKADTLNIGPKTPIAENK